MKIITSITCAGLALLATSAQAQRPARDLGVREAAETVSATEFEIEADATDWVFCRTPFALSNSVNNNRTILRIGDDSPPVRSGPNGRNLRPGQCGNIGGNDRGPWSKYMLNSFIEVSPNYARGYDFMLSCSLADDRIFAFRPKDGLFNGTTHCLVAPSLSGNRR